MQAREFQKKGSGIPSIIPSLSAPPPQKKNVTSKEGRGPKGGLFFFGFPPY